jgi:ABC-type multidrug transport system ATPase subunit
MPNVDPTPKLLLQLKGIVKSFAGVQALKGVDFDLRAGEVHALMGENGAGKSTLMKILFGVQPPDSGTIEIDGHGQVAIDDPRHALALGVGLVSQEPSLVPQLDVAQNIFLGQTEALNVVKRAEFQAKAREILKPLAPRLPVTTKVGNLGMAEMQVVEIARTLARGANIIGFDEPTSSLTPAERDGLFALIRQLKNSGKGIIYISHRIPEVYAICDLIWIDLARRTVSHHLPVSEDRHAIRTASHRRRRHRRSEPVWWRRQSYGLPDWCPDLGRDAEWLDVAKRPVVLATRGDRGGSDPGRVCRPGDPETAIKGRRDPCWRSSQQLIRIIISGTSGAIGIRGCRTALWRHAWKGTSGPLPGIIS